MMRIPRFQYLGALALSAALVPTLASAQQVTAAGQQAAGEVDRYVVGQAVPEPLPGTTLLPLTLEEAMDIALEKNLNLKAARMNPQIVDYNLASARAAFTPQLTSQYSYRDAASPNNNRLEERAIVNQIGQTYNFGVNQTLPWLGGRFSVNFNNQRQSTNSS